MTELADYAWLTAPETVPLLEELADDDAPLHVQLSRLRKVHGPERARLAAELVGLRRKAVSKFGQFAARMFFTEIGFQQSTDLWIAQHKAKRFPSGKRCFDYCCGIGGDLLGLAQRGPAVGIDRAAEACELARANLANWGPGEDCELRVGDVEEFPPSHDVAWHIDPDRRSEGRRSTRLEWFSPSPELIEKWLATAPDAAVKLAPATQVPDEWQERAELEWISRDRECRQQVAWFGTLATVAGKRRATKVTPSAENESEYVANSFVGEGDVSTPLTTEVQEFVYDTDPSVRAAGLTGAFGTENGLEAFSTGASYLTGATQIEHPLTSCFRVLEELPLREKVLAAHFRDRGIGTLEIKKRDVAIDPEQLRRRLKLQGEACCTLLLTRIGKREVALVAERC